MPTLPDSSAIDPTRGPILLGLARRAVEERVRTGEAPPVPPGPHAGWLEEPGATFVTLLSGGKLRGCLGTLEARRSLVEDLWSNAIAAATRDPRFDPVEPHELAALSVEVSVLGRPRPLEVASRAEALAALRPGVDGVVFRWRRHRSTFLPQVWEQLSAPEDFLGHLARKAGLAMDFWAEDVQMETYRVEKYAE